MQNNLAETISQAQAQTVGAQLTRHIRLELIRRMAAEKRILEWGKLLFPEKFELPFCCELHNHMVEIRHEPKTGDEAPRNHAKTTIKCFLIPIFQALNEPGTFRHYLNVQATGEKAVAVNVAIKHEIETNPDIYAIYGNMMGKRWTDKRFVLANGTIFTAVGAGQSIRGLNYQNIRPDYIIIDDLYDEEDINNPVSTLKKNQWFWSSLYPARAKSRKCCIHLQGTAINDQDLLEKLKKQDGWKCRTFKAIKNFETPNEQVLWPELNTRASLEKDQADMGSVIFMREMQNERREETTAIIKRAWLDYYDTAEFYKSLSNHFFVSGVLMGCDPSIGKDKTENDFTGIALVIQTSYDDGRGTEFWIENVWNKKLSLDKRITALTDVADSRPKKYPVTQCHIESISGFQDFTQEVIRRTNLPVKEIDAVKDKISNLEGKSHFFENKKVHINKNIDPVLLDILIYQLTTNFPLHDDVRDAVLLTLNSTEGLWNFVR